jgi:hypothetical protein
MNLYTKDQLKLLKEKAPISIYNRIKKVNMFLNKDYSKYFEAMSLIQQGEYTWNYSTSLQDIKFFSKTQENLLDLIN